MRRFLRMVTAAAAVLSLAVLGVAVWYVAGGDALMPATTSVAHQPAKPESIPGVENFAQISPSLYRGAQPSAEGFRELKKRGIKTVVNLRSFNSDRDELKGTGLRYAHINCVAWHPEEEDIVKFMKVMSDPANYPVFVHCQHGSDRTGMMVATYRMLEQGWTIDEALTELPVFGFHEIWKVIRQHLGKTDPKTLRQKVKEAPAMKVDVVE